MVLKSYFALLAQSWLGTLGGDWTPSAMPSTPPACFLPITPAEWTQPEAAAIGRTIILRGVERDREILGEQPEERKMKLEAEDEETKAVLELWVKVQGH